MSYATTTRLMVLCGALAWAGVARAQVDEATLRARIQSAAHAFDFAATADALEALALAYPDAGPGCDTSALRCLDARSALRRALALRLSLRQYAEADHLVSELEPARPELATEARLAIAEALLPDRPREALERAERLTRDRRHAALTSAMAHDVGARAAAELGDEPARRRHLDAIIALWEGGALHIEADRTDHDALALESRARHLAATAYVERPAADDREALAAALQRATELNTPAALIRALERLAAAEVRVPATRARGLERYRRCTSEASRLRWPSPAAARCRAAHGGSPEELIGRPLPASAPVDPAPAASPRRSPHGRER